MAPDDVERAIQEARYQVIEQRLSDARLLGDAVIAAFVTANKPSAREVKRQEVESWLNEPPATISMKVSGLAAALRDRQPPIPPFHWEIELPEVFSRENPGFDAMMGNPPFLGGKRISTELSDAYRDWLPALHTWTSRNMDLVGHFFRRCYTLIRSGGVFGLILQIRLHKGTPVKEV